MPTTEIELWHEIHGRQVVLCLRVEYEYLAATGGRSDEPGSAAGCEVCPQAVLCVQEEDGGDWTPKADEEAELLGSLTEDDYDEIERYCLSVVHGIRDGNEADKALEGW